MSDLIRQISMQKAIETVQDQKELLNNYARMIASNEFNKKLMINYKNQAIRYDGKQFIDMQTRKPLSKTEQKKIKNFLVERLKESIKYLNRVENYLQKNS